MQPHFAALRAAFAQPTHTVPLGAVSIPWFSGPAAKPLDAQASVCVSERVVTMICKPERVRGIEPPEILLLRAPSLLPFLSFPHRPQSLHVLSNLHSLVTFRRQISSQSIPAHLLFAVSMTVSTSVRSNLR